MRLRWHKWTHWEYWSVYVVYMPTFFLWLWYMLKFRSIKFYTYANPSITNGGLYADSKFSTYQLLPRPYYPKTILVEKGKEADFSALMQEHHFSFPLIAKPDIGCRGVGVQKVLTMDELTEYAKASEGDFLMQEVVELPQEIGLFYCRLPYEKRGKITGITLKKFLTVEGNGKDTIEQLLRKKPRFEMQIPTLKNKMDLLEILPSGEKRCLVPYGNHNRGTEFTDGKNHITPKLEETFNALLSTVPGFYYGRLDIRFNSFEELEEGKNFSIIELNGAKSEPTHMYDPKHSFWYGQREIYRHQKIFRDIVNANTQQVTAIR